MTKLNVHIAGVLETGEGMTKVVNTTVAAEKVICFSDSVKECEDGREAHNAQMQIYGDIGRCTLVALMKALADRFGAKDLIDALQMVVEGEGIETSMERDMPFREDVP